MKNFELTAGGGRKPPPRPTFDLREVEGFGEQLYARVSATFPTEAWRDAPYRLTEVRGVGFLRADRVARRLGVAPKDPDRINAGAEYLLNEAEQGGNTCLPIAEFADKLMSLLEIRLADFEFSNDFYEQDGLIGLRRTYEAEALVALELCRLAQRPVAPSAPVGMQELYDDQRAALAVIESANIFVLLGSPGTGKTRLVKHIVESAQGTVALAAPTGKAAKRIEELTGYEAKTIHRLLEPSDKGVKGFSRGFQFQRNSRHPLKVDTVIVDESSMLDVKLLADLMSALPAHCRLIMVGDPFQLPSVGPGAVLRDLIGGHGVVPYVELIELKRQNPELLIARNCQEIRWHKRIIVDNKQGGDFIFLPYATPAATAEAVVDLLAERIPAKYGIAASEIMVITPLRKKGELSVEALNRKLRARLNPTVEYDDGKTPWAGDRVIQRSNDRELDVVNGDTGTVVWADNKKLTVVFDTPAREVTASRADFDLELAYALTIHKAQGSQAPAVVFVVDGSGPAQFLADSQLTYTAISRASEICVAVGDLAALNKQVARHRAVNRWTRLDRLLRIQ